MNELQKTLALGAGILALLAFTHWFAYNRGKNDLRLELLSAPVKVDTTRGAEIRTAMPAETLGGPSRAADTTHHHRPPMPPGIAQLGGTLIPCTAVVNSLLDSIGILNEPKRADPPLTDSLGGRHDITFTPSTGRFSEVFTPVRIEQPFTVERERYVPMGESSWIASLDLETIGSAAGAGLGLGRKPVVLRWKKFSDGSTSWGASVQIEF